MNSTRWSIPRPIPLDDISYGHSPDKRGENTKYGHLPIWVIPKFWGGYRVDDGNDRLYYAIQRGDTCIFAHVRGESTDCPTCGAYVFLVVRDVRDADYRLSGRCPNDHLACFDYRVGDPTIRIGDLR
jgi:hypothetical protein